MTPLHPLPLRAFLFCLACFVLSLSGCTARQAQERASAPHGLELVILHVNDTHAHVAGIDPYGNAAFSETGSRGGYGRIAAAIRQARAAGDNVLALDAGDQFQGTLYYSVNKWPLLADMDRHLPYDAMTLGNHEFDEGCLELSRFLEMVPFPVLAANLAPEKGCPLLQSRVVPYVVREIRGHRVGIVGLANDASSLAAACPQTRFLDTTTALRGAVKELEQQGVRHIVALTHLGLPADRQLARSVDGVDVIVGGHTHSYLGPGSAEGPYPVVERSPSGQPVLVVTAKRATQYLGRLDVVFDREGIPLAWDGGPRELMPGDAGTPAISALVGSYTATLEALRKDVVGSRHMDGVPDGMDACREGECLGGMVTTDAMLAYARPYGAVIALCNGGAIRAALPRGPITRGDLLTMHPFGNTMVLREYSGAQIRQALEHGVAGEGGKGPRLLQVAGLRYAVDARRPAGKRVVRVQVVDGRGKAAPLSPQARYGVILPAYLAGGGDGHAALKDGKALPSPDPLDVDLVERYLRTHDPLPLPARGRISRVDQED